MKLIALICILHRLMATPSSLVLKLRQFSKLALNSKPSKHLLESFCHVIACRPPSQSPILKPSRVLQMCCKHKEERIGIAKILFLSSVST